MDAFVLTHTSSSHEGADGTMTMGYYTREDLAFYYALADAFTLCDGYHSSILGPTQQGTTVPAADYDTSTVSRPPARRPRAAATC